MKISRITNKAFLPAGSEVYKTAVRQDVQAVQVQVKNPITIFRNSETISVNWNDISGRIDGLSAGNVSVFDLKANCFLVTQTVDIDNNKMPNELLFQADFAPGEQRGFRIMKKPEGFTAPVIDKKTFCRFVPERYDDFAWENDLTAFRTYGPALREEGAGSGVDCWLKRVKYPIINKWYQESANGKSYHNDHGEGHDPYDVGKSRGCGGLALWKNNKIIPSSVFDSWKIIANGPIRSIFELTYDKSWKEVEEILEVKRITIDLGQRLCRFKSSFSGKSEPKQIPLAVGITTHNGKAVGKWDKEKGWLRCWETIHDSELGTGIVIDPDLIKEIEEIKSNKKDESHIMLITSTDKEGKITYYAGYGWKKANEITCPGEWDKYLEDFAMRIAAPMEVILK